MIGRGLIVAGTASGVGKTTVTSAIAAALTARGLTVQPYKAGPDYIDPGHLGRAAGREARNLDTWMLPRAVVVELFGRAANGADVTLVEGVMGLFDGRSGTEDEGSAADLARLLALPVLDASAVARSIAATVLGFQTFDPTVRIAGVILNRVAGEAHAEMCRVGITQATGLPVVGALPRSPEIAWPERHLGLVPEAEVSGDPGLQARLAAFAEAHLDLELLLRLAAPAGTLTGEAAPTGLFPATPPAQRVPIAIARDRAFHFYYPDALELLEAWGADLLPFSPLEDGVLPAGARGVARRRLPRGVRARTRGERGDARRVARRRGTRRADLRRVRRADVPGPRAYGRRGRAPRDGGPAPVRIHDAGHTPHARLSRGGVVRHPAAARGRARARPRVPLVGAHRRPRPGPYRFVDQAGRAEGVRSGSVTGTYLPRTSRRGPTSRRTSWRRR